jgi:uncharacterized protein YlxW (UPF0749 family)
MSRVGPDMSWERPDRWRRALGRGPTLRPASRPATKLAAAILAGAIGFLAVIQARQQADPAARLESERPEDLARILADLNAEADLLARQVSSLRVRIERYRSSGEKGRLALEDARESLADLQVLAGLVAATGPGVELTVIDPQGRVSWEAILDLVQELRDAGAEALAIDGRRVVVSTWFGPAERGMEVDGEPIEPPFEIHAVGSPDALREALEIQGGPVAVIAAEPGVEVTIVERGRLTLPSLQRSLQFQYARPTS